jgi:hypothetical protein
MQSKEESRDSRQRRSSKKVMELDLPVFFATRMGRPDGAFKTRASLPQRLLRDRSFCSHFQSCTLRVFATKLWDEKENKPERERHTKNSQAATEIAACKLLAQLRSASICLICVLFATAR